MSANAEEDDLFRVLKPMRVMYSFIGCSYTSHLGRHKRKFGAKVFGAASKFLAAIALAVSLWGLPRCTRRHRSITAATKFITGYVDVVVTAGNLVFAFANRRTLTCTLSKFVAVDVQLRKISCPKIKSRRRVHAALILCASLHLLKLIIDGLAVAAGILRLFCMCVHMLRYTLTLIIECYLVLLLAELRARLKILNDHIAGVIAAPRRKTQPIDRFRMVVANATTDSLVKSGKLHAELCEIGKMINRSFEGHVLIINFASFVHVVSSFFYLVEVVDKRHYFKDLRHYFYILYWILTYAAETFAVFYAFTSVSAEAKKTANILHSRKSIDTKIKHSDLMVIFTKQLYFQNAKFSVYQLYPLDWTALFFILCNVFTFLIILLQFNSIINGDEV